MYVYVLLVVHFVCIQVYTYIHTCMLMTPHGMIDVCAARMSDDERRMQSTSSTRVVSMHSK